MRAAIALYQGNIILGNSLQDSIIYDKWEFAQAHRLRSVVSDCLSELVQAQIMLSSHPLSQKGCGNLHRSSAGCGDYWPEIGKLKEW